MRLWLISIVSAICAPSGDLFAHHSSEPYYDLARVIEIEGRIIEVFWQNPHIKFTLQDDNSEEWDVETTDVSYPHFDKTGIPQTEAVHYEERFTVNPDGSRLNYIAFVTDPTIFTEPVQLTKTWVSRPGEEINPYVCTL